MTNILVTGSQGFIGKNLIAELRNRNYVNIFEVSRETDADELDFYCKSAGFVFHLAGVNRPQYEEEFMNGNYGFTELLIQSLQKHDNHCPIVFSSSSQAEQINPYGKSKRAGEVALLQHREQTNAKLYIYRFPNIFGKWCRPNYNSAIATFCHNITHDLPIKVNDPSISLNLVYIDDVIGELINTLEEQETVPSSFCTVPVVYAVSLGKIVELIYSFKQSRVERSIPDMSDDFTKKLYSTYLSYLPCDNFSYPLKMNIDNRGSFTEFIKTKERGQVSINISKPGVTKGDHWHHTKNEKFLVVSGKGVIRFRKIDCTEIIEYFVSEDLLEVVDVPVGYTHNIENLGESDMITIIWANEAFDPLKPDTYFVKV